MRHPTHVVQDNNAQAKMLYCISYAGLTKITSIIQTGGIYLEL